MAAKTPEGENAEATPKKKGGKKRLLIPVLVLLLGLGGGGYFFLGSSGKKAAAGPPTTTTTQLGDIIRLDDITLNLSDGHVLKVGLALQMVEKPKNKQLAAILTAAAAAAASSGSSSSGDTTSPLSGQEAIALDLAISQLGNDTYAQLSQPGGREAAKDALSQQIEKAYNGDVVGVYFTDFVMS